MYRSEVWVVAAVVASRDGDVLALKDARVALHPLLVAGLYEHHLLVVVHLVARHVASQHALIAMAGFYLDEHRIEKSEKREREEL